MARRLRALGTGVMLLGAGTVMTTSCSSPPGQEPEAIGESLDPLAPADAGGASLPGGPLTLTPASQNYSATGSSYTGRHETAVAYVNGTFTQGTGQWMVAWNSQTSVTTEAGWSFSPGTLGSSAWTPNEITSGTQWGNAGTSPCNASWSFTGWRGDPTLAPVTDPTLNGSSTRALYAMIGETTGGDTDIVVALSKNGGQNWGHTSYVTDSTTCSSSGNADIPNMVSNPVSPYDTYISYEDVGTGKNYLQRIWYDNSFVLHKGFSPALTMGGTSSPWTGQRHRIGFIKLPSGCTSGGEGVAIAWAPGFSGARCSTPGQSLVPITWYLGIYDTGNGNWYGPWTVYSITGNNWNQCVGANYAIYNVPDPGLATNPTAAGVWLALTTPYAADGTTHYGNKIHVSHAQIVCNGGTPGPNTWTQTTMPEPCDLVQGTCTYGNKPGGGYYIQDEWEPAISFVAQGTTNRAVMHWYGTRNDISNNNVGVYAAESDNNGSWSTPQIISYCDTGSCSTEVIPWVPINQGMWDFNTLGAAWAQGTFLAAWGGDNRKNTGSGSIETELLQ